MTKRSAGFLLTLWFFFAVMMVFIACAFSPMGLAVLLPEKHPATWIVPALLSAPPLVLIGPRFLPSGLSTSLRWVSVVALVLPVVALFLFLAAMFVGH